MTSAVGPFALLPAQLQVVKFAAIEEWEASAKTLFEMQKWSPWWIGDLMVYGEARFGDDAWQIPPLDASASSVERFVAVARKIPPEARMKSLSFQHHLLALRIKEPSVRQAALRKAESDAMNTEEFGKFLRQM
jgi:hypothetical protein